MMTPITKNARTSAAAVRASPRKSTGILRRRLVTKVTGASIRASTPKKIRSISDLRSKE
jgi:hypothetical protein